GTLIFVSHDRYFVERLATKIIEVGNGTAVVFPGTYKEFLWHKEHGGQERQDGRDGRERREGRGGLARPKPGSQVSSQGGREQKKRADAEARRRQRAEQARRAEIDALEARIAECEQAIKELE